MVTRISRAITTKREALSTAWTKYTAVRVQPLTVMFGKWVLMHRSLRRFTEHRTLFNLLLERRCGLLKRNSRTSQVPLLLTIKGTRCPVLSRLLEQAAQKAARMETAKPSPSMPREATRFTELRTSSSRQPGKLCGSSNFDNPERFTSRGLNNLGISVDGV